MKKPLILMILDGFGIGTNFGNAIREANKPNMEKIFSTNPTTLIAASGMDVGLPDGQMGNSEVGHTNMGAGRVVYQELTRISKAIKEGTVYDNEVLVKAMNNAAEDGKALHVMGLLSPGGVHSHSEHLYGLLELAKKNEIHSIAFPAISTGVYCYPKTEAAEIALKAINDWFGENEDYGMNVIMSCFDKGTYDTYQKIIDKKE